MSEWKLRGKEEWRAISHSLSKAILIWLIRVIKIINFGNPFNPLILTQSIMIIPLPLHPFLHAAKQIQHFFFSLYMSPDTRHQLFSFVSATSHVLPFFLPLMALYSQSQILTHSLSWVHFLATYNRGHLCKIMSYITRRLPVPAPDGIDGCEYDVSNVFACA